SSGSAKPGTKAKGPITADGDSLPARSVCVAFSMVVLGSSPATGPVAQWPAESAATAIRTASPGVLTAAVEPGSAVPANSGLAVPAADKVSKTAGAAGAMVSTVIWITASAESVCPARDWANASAFAPSDRPVAAQDQTPAGST